MPLKSSFLAQQALFTDAAVATPSLHLDLILLVALLLCMHTCSSRCLPLPCLISANSQAGQKATALYSLHCFAPPCSNDQEEVCNDQMTYVTRSHRILVSNDGQDAIRILRLQDENTR